MAEMNFDLHQAIWINLLTPLIKHFANTQDSYCKGHCYDLNIQQKKTSLFGGKISSLEYHIKFLILINVRLKLDTKSLGDYLILKRKPLIPL